MAAILYNLLTDCWFTLLVGFAEDILALGAEGVYREACLEDEGGELGLSKEVVVALVDLPALFDARNLSP